MNNPPRSSSFQPPAGGPSAREARHTHDRPDAAAAETLTKAGEVKLAARKVGGSSLIEFAVSDTGIGMTPEQQGSIIGTPDAKRYFGEWDMYDRADATNRPTFRRSS